MVKRLYKDYVRKRNIKNNNWPVRIWKGKPLVAGDGILPKSKKFKK